MQRIDVIVYVLPAALFDFLGEKRIGDRGAGGANHVEHAVLDHAHHRVGRGKATNTNDGLRRQGFEAAHVFLLRAFGAKARSQRVEVPVAHHQVPDVGDLADDAEDLFDLRALEPGLADQLVNAQPAGDGDATRGHFDRVFEYLTQQTRAVFDRPTVGIGARVIAARQEMLQDGEPVAGIDVDDVIARRDRPLDTLTVPAA